MISRAIFTVGIFFMAWVALRVAKSVNENPNLIRKTLKKFCPKAVDISNRRLAIHTAISAIDKKDILIIAGKGHEKYQIIKNKNYEFDDYKIAKDFIK